MTTHLPPELQTLLKLTVGMPWPEGDEGEMWDLARSWRTFADELDQLASDLDAEASAFGRAIEGDTGTALQKHLRDVLGKSAGEMRLDAAQ